MIGVREVASSNLAVPTIFINTCAAASFGSRFCQIWVRQMERMSCSVTEMEPEVSNGHVSEPQFTTIWTSPSDAVVMVYFMENTACSIEDPHAVAVGPDISLRYTPVSASGAYTASVRLRKLEFRFSGFTQRRRQFSLRAMKGRP